MGAIHRDGRPTLGDYDEVIKDLEAARTQVEPDGRDCAVCGDSGHQAWECHHNPLVLARRAKRAETEYRCYHCGDVFTDDKAALAHFGTTSFKRPTCCEFQVRVGIAAVSGESDVQYTGSCAGALGFLDQHDHEGSSIKLEVLGPAIKDSGDAYVWLRRHLHEGGSEHA